MKSDCFINNHCQPHLRWTGSDKSVNRKHASKGAYWKQLRSNSSNKAIHPPVQVKGRHQEVLGEGQCDLAVHLSEFQKLNLKTNGRIFFLSVRIKQQFKQEVKDTSLEVEIVHCSLKGLDTWSALLFCWGWGLQ